MHILPEPKVIPEISIKLNGTDVASKTVTLTDGVNTYTGTTGSAGGCTIKNILEGTYHVSVESNNLNDIIVSETNTSFEFTLD
ncbi:hypothetical protein [Methanobrevibacter sp. V74]|uniref:hypothetical protein n=1 Tax=Methanobrevibacter sp. V74 TaxID=3064279 RepID=UPI0027352BE4|nr:hypothetical protein [Methanobrevibacter sp. V74]